MMWWLKDAARLRQEIGAIEALHAANPWLTRIAVRPSGDYNIVVDFDLALGDEILSFSLRYPTFFPETPPMVVPRDERRYSQHQYGAGGELCLEHRPDNWDPAVTGAMMIESAWRLLSGEREPEAGPGRTVPDAHQASLGQRLRASFCRFTYTAGLREVVGRLQLGERLPASVQESMVPGKVYSAFVASAGPVEAPVFRETTIPTKDASSYPATIVRLESLSDIKVADEETLNRLTGLPSETPANDNGSARFTILGDDSGALMFCSYFYENVWKVLPYRTIDVSGEVSRLPPAFSVLPGKKVGIVGGGALGSKIAASLARSGVGAFVLVDDDVVKPGNLVRNELDAVIGAHKVDAIEARLLAVAPNARVTRHRIALGAQESAAMASLVFNDLASCDLLIDATADPQAFNLVAAVSRSALKPMIWAEVYAGGIGGFVARVRPNHEPPPHAARRQYLGWCRDQNVPWEGFDVDYEARREELPPLVADDADVAVIAAHTTRMALDILVSPDASAFPHSGYVIGLAREWIFTEPFDTRPIDFVAEGEWALPLAGDDVAATMEYVISLFERTKDESRASA